MNEVEVYEGFGWTHQTFEPAPPLRYQFAELAMVGWPIHSLKALYLSAENLDEWRWAWPINPVLWLDVLPLRPIWPGFAINTVFYAAILWLLIPGPFVLRRFLRVRRGRCPKCAYPMRDSPICSECGKPLPQRAVA